MSPFFRLTVAAAALAVFAAEGCAREPKPVETGFGPDPELPAPEKNLLPTVNVAKAEAWADGAQPTPGAGLAVTEFAAGLDHPRWLYVLPNGDVLVAETNAPPKEEKGGIKAFFMKMVMKKAGAAAPSANRITLLRDADGDGVAEMRSPFIEGLFSPFGMALVGDTFYIANADAVVSVPYETGATSISAAPEQVFALPGGPLNHHWTKNIVASPDGARLYAAVGSNSNVGENGLEMEEGRAAIWEIDVASGEGEVFASGLRNPVGMDFDETTNTLYTVVNERDELGDNLVPDYLTSVREDAFYGWPYSYYGNHVDTRVEPPNPDLVSKAIAPDYALGSHTASLGLVIADGDEAGAAGALGRGAFIGQHGSWNRNPRSGYKVIFVPFIDAGPEGDPVDVLTGFLDAENDVAHGRPVGVAIDARGDLLVADDVGNRVWRVSATDAVADGN